MTRKVCHSAIRGRIGDAFTDAEIDAVLDRVIERYKAKTQTEPTRDLTEIFREAVSELSDEQVKLELIERRMKIKAAQARAFREKQFAKMDAGLPEKMPENEKLKILNVGSEKHAAGHGLSVDARRRAYYMGWSGELINELEKIGTLARLTDPLKRRDKNFEADVAKELSRANGGADAPTGNKDAEMTAAVMKKIQDDTVNAQNAQGAWISRLPGYVTRQTHDAIKVSGKFWSPVKASLGAVADNRRVSFKKMREARNAARQKAQDDWVEFIRPRLAAETFEGVPGSGRFPAPDLV